MGAGRSAELKRRFCGERDDLGGDVPCVREDDVVEGSVLLAEAGEAYP